MFTYISIGLEMVIISVLNTFMTRYLGPEPHRAWPQSGFPLALFVDSFFGFSCSKFLVLPVYGSSNPHSLSCHLFCSMSERLCSSISHQKKTTYPPPFCLPTVTSFILFPFWNLQDSLQMIRRVQPPFFSLLWNCQHAQAVHLTTTEKKLA